MNESNLELSVILPVYNEAEAIGSVVDAWSNELDRLAIDYEIVAYDDGSKDQTLDVLNALAGRVPRLRVHTHPNRGHGPTILEGYREASAPWVFQTDSDDEMPADEFHRLWERREDHDFLVGWRENRQSPLPRRIITGMSRLAVRLMYGSGIRDVNSPYRLMRRFWLVTSARLLPDDTFAPNVLLSGLAVRDRLRIFQCPVPHRARRTGQVSIVRWKLWASAMRAFLQTARFAIGTKRKHDTAL